MGGSTYPRGVNFWPSARRTLRGLLGAVAVVLLVGCSAAGTDPRSSASADPTPGPSVSASALPGRTLAELGFRNGPVQEVSLPIGTRIEQAVDQENMVTLVLPGDEGEAVAAHLLATLPGRGWQITGASTGNLTFTGHGWDGAFTTAPKLSGLTLRIQG